MQSSKSNPAYQVETRRFKAIVQTDPELVYSEGKPDTTLLAFDAWVYEGNRDHVCYQVVMDLRFWAKRKRLFQAGHRLVLDAATDNVSPVLYATDARFDRERPYCEPESQ
jgi:hypothetical protein